MVGLFKGEEQSTAFLACAWSRGHVLSQPKHMNPSVQERGQGKAQSARFR